MERRPCRRSVTCLCCRTRRRLVCGYRGKGRLARAQNTCTNSQGWWPRRERRGAVVSVNIWSRNAPCSRGEHGMAGTRAGRRASGAHGQPVACTAWHGCRAARVLVCRRAAAAGRDLLRRTHCAQRETIDGPAAGCVGAGGGLSQPETRRDVRAAQAPAAAFTVARHRASLAAAASCC